VGPALGAAPNVEFMPWSAEFDSRDQFFFFGGQFAEDFHSVVKDAMFREAILGTSEEASIVRVRSKLMEICSKQLGEGEECPAIVVLRSDYR